MLLAHLPKPQVNTDILKMPIIRSFNINKPGTKIEDLQGGVIGGSIISGVVKTNDELFLVPGMITKNEETNTFYYNPLACKIESINSEKNNLTQAGPGGLIGIKLDVDPGLTVDDKLTGNILVNKITGVVTNTFEAILKSKYVFEQDKQYIFNINSNNINGRISSKIKNNNIIKIKLENYQYIDDNDIITISISQNGSVNLVGYCVFSKELHYNQIKSN
jgi:translation initiation factor 2 subunit 3